MGAPPTNCDVIFPWISAKMAGGGGSVGDTQRLYEVGAARFIDASTYRDTFSAIRIAILFLIITIFFVQ